MSRKRQAGQKTTNLKDALHLAVELPVRIIVPDILSKVAERCLRG